MSETSGVYQVDTTEDIKPEIPPDDLGESGKLTLQKLRQQLKDLEKENKFLQSKYSGIDIDEIKTQEKTLTQQIVDLKTDNQELKKALGIKETELLSQIQQKENELSLSLAELKTIKNRQSFNEVAGLKLDSRFIQLAWDSAKDRVSVEGDQLTLQGKTLDVFVDDFLAQYPESGKKTVGSGIRSTGGSSSSNNGVRTLPKTDDSFLQNLDDIISGKVILE